MLLQIFVMIATAVFGVGTLARMALYIYTKDSGAINYQMIIFNAALTLMGLQVMRSMQ